MHIARKASESGLCTTVIATKDDCRWFTRLIGCISETCIAERRRSEGIYIEDSFYVPSASSIIVACYALSCLCSLSSS